MDKKIINSLLDSIKSEIEYALYSKKSKEVKEHYLKNAIRYSEEIKEEMERP